MFQIKKKKLADLAMVYAVSIIELDGKPWCLAASEAEGGDYILIEPESGKVYPLEGLSGGVMSLVPIPEEPWTFIVIQKFYPIFRSDKAEIAKVKLNRPDALGSISCEIEKITDLPYVHRIALTGECGKRTIIAATLCRTKENIEDWSSAGGVYAIGYPVKPGKKVQSKLILDGIHRNHGLFELKEPEKHAFYIGGDEGVFELVSSAEAWIIRNILPISTSDVSINDIDQDGENELLTIQPFHGNELNIYKQDSGKWQLFHFQPLEFGHVLWSGKIQGKPHYISGSRSGDKALKILSFNGEDPENKFGEQIIDQGTAPSQIAVTPIGDSTYVIAANHDAGEVVAYCIT